MESGDLHNIFSLLQVFSYAGFIAAVIWIQLIAGEIVGLLKVMPAMKLTTLELLLTK